jgi:hypothetical protein
MGNLKITSSNFALNRGSLKTNNIHDVDIGIIEDELNNK